MSVRSGTKSEDYNHARVEGVGPDGQPAGAGDSTNPDR